MTEKTVLVSGCFDLLHGGHVSFFKEAASFGKLIVCLGSDANIKRLKFHDPLFSQEERLFLVENIKYVHQATIATGTGMLDYEPEMARLKPTYFVVNDDGYTPEKEALCKKYGVELKVLNRIPEEGLPSRSSTSLKERIQKIENDSHVLNYRICLAGGWMDQPWVSKIHPGSVVVVNIYPTIKFNDRSGMGTSSRKTATELWGTVLPNIDPVKRAKLIFGAENPPGNPYISGSQDQIGLSVPGVSRLYYNGQFWPETIDNNVSEEIANWLEEVIHMIPLQPRPQGYNPLMEKNLSPEIIKALGLAGDLCYNSILNKDLEGFGRSLTNTVKAWQKMLPYTVNEHIIKELEKYKDHPGAIFSGSGGGYIVVASDQKIEGALKVKVRIKDDKIKKGHYS